MRTLILRDKCLPEDEFDEAVAKVKSIYEGVGIKNVQISEEEYYWGDPNEPPRSDLWEVYYDGYWGMKVSFLTALVRQIEQRYGKKFDHIVIAMDDRNWYGDIPENKVWGWNIGAGVLGYDVQQCRVDTVSKRRSTRIANTVGTLFHETMHSHDEYPYRVFNGINIVRYLKTKGIQIRDWDSDVVHGAGADWDYIRYDENQEALKAIVDVLNACYETRKRQDETGKTALEALQESIRTAIVMATRPFAVACRCGSINKHY